MKKGLKYLGNPLFGQCPKENKLLVMMCFLKNRQKTLIFDFYSQPLKRVMFFCVCVGSFRAQGNFYKFWGGGLHFELCTLTGVLDLYSQPFRVPVVLCPEVLSPFRSFTISEFYPFWKAGASLKRFIQSRSHSWQVRVGGILFSSEDPNHILYLQEEMYFPIKRFPLKRDRNI